MKKTVLSIALWLLMSTIVCAMPAETKNNAFERTREIETEDGNRGSAVFWKTEDDGGYWWTANHVLDGSLPRIDGYEAIVVAQGSSDRKSSSCTVDDWALLRTPKHHLMMFDAEIDRTVDVNERLHYVNLNKYRTITKVTVRGVDEGTFYTNTSPQPGNSGAGVFNAEGQLVGIVVGSIRFSCYATTKTLCVAIPPAAGL